jgi:hypothetical protein
MTYNVLFLVIGSCVVVAGLPIIGSCVATMGLPYVINAEKVLLSDFLVVYTLKIC